MAKAKRSDAKPIQGAKSTKRRNQETKNTEKESTSSTLEAGTQAIDTDAASSQPTADATPPTETIIHEGNAGDDSLSPAVTDPQLPSGPFADMVPTRARPGETRSVCWERARREGRAAGLPKGQGPGTAYEWANLQIDRLFPAAPPPEPEPIPVEEPEPVVVEDPEPELSPIGEKSEATPPEVSPATIASDQGVPGLGTMPDAWGILPANASLQAEISWVSANRLRVRDGTGVDLAKALSPAPSYSALSWLETSILFPSKFADISVKATANQDDEKESVRREKLAIEEIRSLLAEMLE